MREVSYYISDDGERFEDENDCLHHELQIRYVELVKSKNLLFVAPNGMLYLAEDDFEEVLYDYSAIVAKSDEAIQFIIDSYCFVGCGILSYLNEEELKKNHRYYWDADHEDWRDLDDDLESLLYINHLLRDED